MQTHPIVSLEKVNKFFGKETLRCHVLYDIDLNLQAGELLMLVGPSGSGKTTLLSIIAGILPCDSGVCKLFGQEWHKMNEKEKTHFRGQQIGYVFQSFNLIPMLTSEENAAIPLLIGNTQHTQALQKAKKRLAQFGLEDKATTYPPYLSGGEQQRVAIARAVIHNPQLILCDEPTSALDHENGRRILRYLRRIVDQEKKGLIIVTHDARIFDFADRIIYMEDGAIKR